MKEMRENTIKDLYREMEDQSFVLREGSSFTKSRQPLADNMPIFSGSLLQLVHFGRLL